MDNTYELKVAGLTRNLALCPVNDKLDIAAFIMFSDVELTVACATELLKRIPDCDCFITAESKGIPLTYEMSRQSGKQYILARKSQKLYMKKAVKVDVKSITTDRLQELYLDTDDMDYLRGKRVVIVDDVVSTGESMAALEHLVHEAGGEIVGEATVLAEGDAKDREGLIYLAPLPLFFK